MKTIGAKELVDSVIKQFPELEGGVLEDDGLIHLQMGTFCRYTQRQIDNQKSDELKRCFNFIRMIMQNAQPDVENAVYVSYLEHLNFADGKQSRAWAYHLLPEMLKVQYERLHSF